MAYALSAIVLTSVIATGFAVAWLDTLRQLHQVEQERDDLWDKYSDGALLIAAAHTEIENLRRT